MAAGEHDFEIEQGATWIRRIAVKDDAGDPWADLSDYEIRMFIREAYDSVTTIIELTQVNGRILDTDLTNAIFTLYLTAVETAALDFSSPARYDVELEDTDGVVTRLLEGKVTLSREVTR